MDIRQVVDELKRRRDDAEREGKRRFHSGAHGYELYNGYVLAYNDALGMLADLPAPAGFDVWVSEDAPAFKAWRRCAWLDTEPDKEVLWRMDKTRYHAEYHRFFEVREDGTYEIEGVFGQRRYRVLPAGSPAPSAPTTQEAS